MEAQMQPAQVEQEWETRAESALALRVSVRTIDRYLKAGQLEGATVGKRRQLVRIASRKALVVERKA
jgi:hypothetical protein